MAQAVQPEVSEVSHCAKLFRTAKTDNERLAALFLVTKLVKSGDTDRITRRKLFDVVGFTFINRLLATTNPVENYDGQPLQQIALAILSCFCTDPELVLHPQITSKIPVFNEFISSTSSPSPLVDDCLQCVQCLTSVSQKGREHLWRYGTLLALCHCFLRQQKGCEIARKLILQMLTDSELLSVNVDQILVVLQLLATQFSSSHSELKFTVARLLFECLLLCGKVITEPHQLLGSIGQGIRDVLQSSIDTPHRNIVLELVGLLCQLYGCSWMLRVAPREKGAKSSSCYLLLVHLVCVEVCLVLEEYQYSSDLGHTSLLSACFAVMEQSIIFLSQQSDIVLKPGGHTQENVLSVEEQLQLHGALVEGLSSVIQFLKHLLSDNAASPQQSDPLILLASVRVLGAWLAEESLSLTEEVYTILPSLIRMCEGSTEQGRDLMKFLLPGLSHLVAEDNPRRVLLQAELHSVLLTHFRLLWRSEGRLTEDIVSQLRQYCAVILTLCITEQMAVKEDATFAAWTEALKPIIMQQSFESHPNLLIECLLICLLVIRKKGLQQLLDCQGPVLQRGIGILTRALQYRLNNASKVWNEIAEVWHIAIQEFIVLIDGSEVVKAEVKQSPFLSTFIDYLEKQPLHIQRCEEAVMISSLLARLS